MKSIALLFVSLFLSLVGFSQTTAIPDANFEQALIDLGIDSDGIINGQVLTSDINTVISLDVSNKNISDLTGIEDFVSLLELQCQYNQLTNLDLSQNIDLTLLYCQYNQLLTLDVTANSDLNDLRCFNNQLTNLDVTQNTLLYNLRCSANSLNVLDVTNNTQLAFLLCNNNQLTSLDVTPNISLIVLRFNSNNIASIDLTQNSNLDGLGCGYNELTSLNIAQNTSLREIYCAHNQLSNLDFTQNILLTELSCESNELTSLNIKNGNNSNMLNQSFNAYENPNLTCIEVDDAPWSTTNWTNIDPQSYFSENCALGTNENRTSNILLYPNPTKNKTTISVKEETTYTLLNMQGQILQTGKLSEGNTDLDVSAYTSGLYFIQIKTTNGSTVEKLIKQ